MAPKVCRRSCKGGGLGYRDNVKAGRRGSEERVEADGQ